jgi:hypothetical protein
VTPTVDVIIFDVSILARWHNNKFVTYMYHTLFSALADFWRSDLDFLAMLDRHTLGLSLSGCSEAGLDRWD